MKARPKKQPAFQTATLIAGALLLLIVFVSAGFIVATHPDDDPVLTPEREAFETAQRQWQRRKPNTYSYSVDRDCFCAAEFRETYTVRVEGGNYRFSLQQDSQRAPPEPLEISDIFELLGKALSTADAVSVTYDAEYGFPDNLRIDWSSDLPDDEQAFYIRELRSLE